MYPADGRKLPDVYTEPATLRHELQQRLGTFPLFNFWGPRASIESSRWIADAAKYIERKFAPTLTLIYIPHLDYNLQRVGPASPAAAEDIRQVDELCADLIHFYEAADARVIVLSEYGIRDVSTTRPHQPGPPREWADQSSAIELGRELLDAGASGAFAVADHQVAHVYVNDRSKLQAVRELLEEHAPASNRCSTPTASARIGIDHARSGDLVAIAAPNAWFTYYYWARRRSRAGLRAYGRYPSQARL